MRIHCKIRREQVEQSDMETPLLEILRQLNVMALAALALLGLVMIYFALTSKVYVLFFFLILGASLVGSANPLIENFSSITRWVAILLLLLSSLLVGHIRVQLGPQLFLGYVAFGFVFLFFSNSDSWQFQRSVLLIVVATAIPFAYGDRPLRIFQHSLVSIAIVATVFSVYNFASLPGHLSEAGRLSGYTKAAPWFSMVLGGLLPFSFWGMLEVPFRWLRIVVGAGFALGFITLVFSGQRAGTIAGLLGVIPLLLMNLRQRKAIGWMALALIFLSVLGYALFQQSSPERIQFLMNRYDREAGLSDREWIWEEALAEINKSPLLGRGTGAAETILISSFHNTYLEVWYNTGLPGLVFFVAAQIYFFCRIVFLIRLIKDRTRRFFLALAFGYMLGFMALCFVESTGAGASNVNIILYLFLGVLVSKKELFETFARQERSGEEAPTADGPEHAISKSDVPWQRTSRFLCAAGWSQ